MLQVRSMWCMEPVPRHDYSMRTCYGILHSKTPKTSSAFVRKKLDSDANFRSEAKHLDMRKTFPVNKLLPFLRARCYI